MFPSVFVIVRESIKVHRDKVPESYVPKYLSFDDNIMQIHKCKKELLLYYAIFLVNTEDENVLNL